MAFENASGVTDFEDIYDSVAGRLASCDVAVALAGADEYGRVEGGSVAGS